MLPISLEELLHSALSLGSKLLSLDVLLIKSLGSSVHGSDSTAVFSVSVGSIIFESSFSSRVSVGSSISSSGEHSGFSGVSRIIGSFISDISSISVSVSVRGMICGSSLMIEVMDSPSEKIKENQHYEQWNQLTILSLF